MIPMDFDGSTFAMPVPPGRVANIAPVVTAGHSANRNMYRSAAFAAADQRFLRAEWHIAATVADSRAATAAFPAANA